MDAKDIIKNSMSIGEMFFDAYLGDLSDEDLLLIPVDGMNPMALQIGHLIAVEHSTLNKIKPGSAPELPEGFEAKHSLKEGDRTDSSRYLNKAAYLQLREAQRSAAKALLESLSNDDLAKPGPMPEFVPTVGATFNLLGLHDLSHVGQYVAVRRKLGKPIAF